jgi:hypothetical protein
MPIPNTYVKINKIDHNGVNNDIALGQATKLKIKYTTEPNYLTIGNILTKTEYPTYWLYKVQSLGSNTADNYIKDYSVSASNVTSTPFPPYPGNPITNFISVVNPSGFWDNTTGLYTTPATSNVALILSASITTSGSSIGGGTSLRIRSSIQGVIASKNIIAGSNVITSLTSSYYPLGGDQLSFNISTFGGDITLKSGSFLVTQSIAPTASVSCSVIIEPYITEPNFYNSDDNAVINLVNEQRESTFALDVDYSDGITPINFGLLVSGSGTSATVPDSNYTSKKSTILKYEGSKSTSQLLNTWTQGDTGTYGKLPTIESLKTVIAYCDWIGGWPPEKENASAMNVLYLIKADGTVVIPNTSQDSLSIMQQTFQTGERVFISTKNSSISTTSPYRTVIRGGSHLEPILYTQYGGLPGVTWNTTMSFEDVVLAPGGNVGNYLAEFKKTSNQTGILIDTETGVNLTFTATLNIETLFSIGGGIPPFLVYGVDIKVLLYNTTTNTLVDSQLLSNDNDFNVNYTSTINNANLQPGIYNIYIQVYNSFSGGIPTQFYPPTITIKPSSTLLNISQYPIFTQPITSSGANSIWNWGNKTTHPYIITSSKQQLIIIMEILRL